MSIANAALNVDDPMLGLTAAPEIATAVPKVMRPSMYSFVGRNPKRADPQYARDSRNGTEWRCVVARSCAPTRFNVVLTRWYGAPIAQFATSASGTSSPITLSVICALVAGRRWLDAPRYARTRRSL